VPASSQDVPGEREARAAYTQAAALYRAAFLAGGGDPWAVGEEALAVRDTALAFLALARPFETVKAEYDALQAARDNDGIAPGPAVYAELADELHAIAAASANINGQMPGHPHRVTT